MWHEGNEQSASATYSNHPLGSAPAPPPPPYQDGRNRARLRRRRSSAMEWAWVVIAAALLGVTLILGLSVMLLVQASSGEVEVIPTSVANIAALPTAVNLRIDERGVAEGHP
ncbi:hypothetical protein HC928_25755 [bacterium]|nr:hypothetical protein [bacterium]